MIEDLIIIIVSLYPFAISGLVAGAVVEIACRVIEKKERKQLRAAHKAQAEADMYEMQKVYTNLLFNQITKGN